MQIWVIIGPAAVWLLAYWFGSLALEASGMEKRKARFQALSAITGTGFTTREAESVVNHPGRRRIVSLLIVFGSTGAVAFVVGLIVAVGAGIKTPSPIDNAIIATVIVLVVLGIALGVLRRIGDAIVRRVRAKPGRQLLAVEDILDQTDAYSVVRLAVGEEAASKPTTIGDTGLTERGIRVLAIERKGKVLPAPGGEAPVTPGDRLLCYGEMQNMNTVQG